MVDANLLLSGWLRKLRVAIENAQEHYNSTTQLGGPGVDVEVDEVCFRAQWKCGLDGSSGKEWLRYIAAMERDGDDMVLMRLPHRFAKGGGQGGGGPLDDEELRRFVLRASGSNIPLFRAGTIVHTDSARAYRNLAWRADDAPQAGASSEDVEVLCNPKPAAWRLESRFEVIEREYASRRETRSRKAEIAQQYAHLRLSHTSVCHSQQKTLLKRSEHTAIRRIVLPPEVALALRGRDPLLRGDVTYRVGGTQKIDGHWRLLRKRAAHKEIQTSLGDQLHRTVLCHQWAHVAGPSTDLLLHLGQTLQSVRARCATVEDCDAAAKRARRASLGGQGTATKWRDIKAGEIDLQAREVQAREAMSSADVVSGATEAEMEEHACDPCTVGISSDDDWDAEAGNRFMENEALAARSQGVDANLGRAPSVAADMSLQAWLAS